MSYYPKDPIFHAGVTDCLPDDHPLAWTSIYCVNCQTMVHAFNNETMSEWFETGRGAWCWECFVPAYNADPEFMWGLPDQPCECGHLKMEHSMETPYPCATCLMDGEGDEALCPGYVPAREEQEAGSG